MKRTTFITAGLLLVLAATGPAAAADKTPHKRHPGYVDGARFVEFADRDGRLIEITLHGRLLRLLGSRALRRHDKTLADILEGLESLQAVIASIPEGESGSKTSIRARETVASLGDRLVDEGWERFARVREGKGEELLAFAHLSSRDDIDGLVVMGVTGGDELLFVNIAGVIDMEAVTTLGDRFGLPGLDGMPADDEIKKRHRQRKSVARGASTDQPATPRR
ncbi:MAG: DUF4252 domain-containing protein [Planctomycetes bacterium]|nr:DUF4252 domain-containing protein [Planctomycetota bacterium]